MKSIDRTRLVTDALGPEIISGVIHALPRLKTLTPDQWEAATARHVRCGGFECGDDARGHDSNKKPRTEEVEGGVAKL